MTFWERMTAESVIRNTPKFVLSPVGEIEMIAEPKDNRISAALTRSAREPAQTESKITGSRRHTGSRPNSKLNRISHRATQYMVGPPIRVMMRI
jgi:hypothetical protein